MASNQNPNRNIVQRSGGFFQDLTDRFRLISRLLMDERVNPLIKILPVATLIYVISPVDLLPVNPVDDAFIVWIGTTLFVELCPPNIVEEHLRNLQQRLTGQWREATTPRSQSQGDVIDGEYYENDPNRPR